VKHRLRPPLVIQPLQPVLDFGFEFRLAPGHTSDVIAWRSRRLDASRRTAIAGATYDNAEFQKAIKEAARKRAYRIITDPARDEALARLRAEMARETGVLGRGEA
jgi:hypothetical protein